MKANCPDCGFVRYPSTPRATCPNCHKPLVLELAVRRDGHTRALTLPRQLRRPVRLTVVQDQDIPAVTPPADDYDEEIEALRALRPRTRGECIDVPRPCPYVSCRYHLYLDTNPKTGSLKLNFPNLEVDELKESCALDVADRGGIILDLVGTYLNIVRERVRQIEWWALKRLQNRVEEE